MSRKEELLLKSYSRPIVLLKKSKEYYLSEYVAPGLHNIGVMLPYTGMHYMLFGLIKEPLVMTSLNVSGEPTVIGDDEALKTGFCDYLLVHNRRIVNRADDSVMRVVNDMPVFIRRSRGYVPLSVKLELSKLKNKTVLALGADYSNVFAIYRNGKAWLSQYNGDIESIKSIEELEKNIKHFLKLFGLRRIDYIACDLHPGFNTTKIAKMLAKMHNSKLISVQHHLAHFLSCIAEHNLSKAVGIVCDGYGYGYGMDGEAWGGEVFIYNGKGVKRIGHLERQAMIGLDMATREPLRLAIAIMSKFMEDDEIRRFFPGIEQKISVWLKQLEQQFNITYTTSCGRFLDAVAAVLGVCERRSYEGEPAMKLEGLAMKGNDRLDIRPRIKDEDSMHVLSTTDIFKQVIDYINDGCSKADIALAVHKTVAQGLAKIANRHKTKVDGNVCFTGGVAYNEIISKEIEERLGNVYRNEKVPCGDGGIALGQVMGTMCL